MQQGHEGGCTYIFINVNYCNSMEMHIKARYSLILFLGVLFFVPGSSRVTVIIKLCAAFVLFYFLPGIFLVNKFLGKCHLISSIILAVLTGMCFQVVYGYFLSFFGISFHVWILLLPGVIAAVLSDYYRVKLPAFNPKEMWLVLAGVAFFVLTYNLAPGEDANGHYLLVNMILENNTIPPTYTVYPEIHLSYHMGFHILDAELEYITGVRNLMAVIGSLCGILMITSSYLCVKSIHDEKSGLVAGTILAFAVLPVLYYLSYGAYASIVLFAVEPLAVFFLWQDTSFSDIPVISIVLAAGFLSHTSFVLFFIPLLFLKNRMFIPSFLVSLILSVPHIVRLQPGYSLQEIVQLTHLWYTPEVFNIQMIPERIGVLVFVCGLLGLLFLKKKTFTFFSVWLLSLLVLAVTSVFRVEFPYWFVFFANRLVDLMVLPLVMLTGIFVSVIGKKQYYIFVLLLILPMVPHFYTIPRSTDGPLFPTDSPAFAADQEGIAWLSQNADESAVILNDWWTGTGSSWITSLRKQRLVFPFLYVHDHFLDILDIPEKSRDVLWVSLAPDTEESYSLLQEWDVDYIFLSSYVEDRVKWRRNSWDITRMTASPNFELVFNKDQTYIFKVKKDWEYTHYFTVKEVEFKENRLQPIDFQGNFPVYNLLKISYRDSFTGMVQFWSANGLAAEIPFLHTGSVTTVVIPFDPPIYVQSVNPVDIVHAEIVTTLPGYDLGNVTLSPHWLVNQYFTLENEGYIYVSGAKTLKIVYEDTFSGSIDINILINQTWVPLTTIQQTGDGTTKVLTIPLSNHFVALAIHAHNAPFTIISLELL